MKSISDELPEDTFAAARRSAVEALSRLSISPFQESIEDVRDAIRD